MIDYSDSRKRLRRVKSRYSITTRIICHLFGHRLGGIHEQPNLYFTLNEKNQIHGVCQRCSKLILMKDNEAEQ